MKTCCGMSERENGLQVAKVMPDGTRKIITVSQFAPKSATTLQSFVLGRTKQKWPDKSGTSGLFVLEQERSKPRRVKMGCFTSNHHERKYVITIPILFLLTLFLYWSIKWNHFYLYKLAGPLQWELFGMKDTTCVSLGNVVVARSATVVVPHSVKCVSQWKDHLHYYLVAKI